MASTSGKNTVLTVYYACCHGNLYCVCCRGNPLYISTGCQKGRRIGYKCFLVYRTYESYAGASKLCQERGGRMAMPRDRKEQEALADYAKTFFHPGNWPVWLGVNDLRAEGLYLFEGRHARHLLPVAQALPVQPAGRRQAGELRGHVVRRR